MNKSDRIYVAGHKGLVGSAFVRTLVASGYENLIVRAREELDLREQGATERFFIEERPQYVILAAARVGGIHANSCEPGEFFYDNLAVQTNVIHSAYKCGVEQLLFLGSSCIYPREAAQPLKEEYLLTGKFEPTNEAYAVAKIAGVKMCEYYNRQYRTNFFSVMPCNLYGPNDNFDLASSHVFPALIRKFCEAKLSHAPQVEVWGTGCVRREFLHVDDMVGACIHLLGMPGIHHPVNVGYGSDLAIAELAQMICEESGYEGEIVWNKSMPDGMPQKLMSTDRIKALGWSPKIPLKEGIRMMVTWYRDNRSRILKFGR